MDKDYQPTGWQRDIISAIEEHQSLRESDTYQGLPDYVINKELSISIAFPRRSGHTLFANYLASKYPSIVIYKDIKHYLALSQPFQFHPQTDMLSMFEISYVLTETMTIPSQNIEDLKNRFANKRIVIVDGGESLPPRVKSFILEASSSAVIFLGK